MLFSFMRTFILDIKKMGINGEGIGYLFKKPVFVQQALLFEKVKIHNIVEYPTYFKAETLKVITPSKHRVKPICPIAEQCGACSLMHADLTLQQQIKIDHIKQSLFKYAKIKNQQIFYHKNPKPLNYRNQCKFILGIDNNKISSGMFERDTNQWLAIDHCVIHHPIVEKTRLQVVKLLNKHKVNIAFKASEEGYRYLIVRALDNKAQVTLISTVEVNNQSLIDDIANLEHVDSVYVGVNNKKTRDFFSEQTKHVAKNKYLDVTINDIKLQVSPQSFMQLNTEVASNMMNFVASKIKPTDQLVEAYCGVGMISLLISKKAKSVYSFDISKEAIANAKNHAAINHCQNVTFDACDADIGIRRANKMFKQYTLIVDPPRSGLTDQFIDTVLKANINQIVYISCNPSTLAKNLRLLQKKFTIQSMDAFDMFSQTQHVEVTVQLVRK